MVLGTAFFLVVILIAAIWLIIEFKRFRHKFLAIILIALIIFTYFSFTVTLKSYDIDYKTIPGIITAGKIYLSWLGTIFLNLKSITTHAINMDWHSANESLADNLELGIKEKFSSSN
jgi:hypothetical protein